MGRLYVPRSTFLSASALLAAVLLALPASYAADSRVPKTEEPKLPTFMNTQLPSISSCDANDVNSGNNILDATLASAKSAEQILKDSKKKAEDGGTVDGKATISTVCREPKNFKIEGAKDTACGVLTDTYIASRRQEVAGVAAALACQRGVLSAIRGELACFKKQLTDAEKFIDSLVNGQGGLAGMLTSGEAEVKKLDDALDDRKNQLDTVNQRINGGEGGTPLGLLAAEKVLRQLTTEGPKAVSAAGNLEDSFNTAVKQAKTAEIYSCLNEPSNSYICTTATSSSDIYTSGSVSVLEHMACRTSQAMNTVVGGKVIKADREKEKKRYAIARSALNIFGPKVIRPDSDLSTDIKSYENKINYKYNTPEQLIAYLRSSAGSLSAGAVAELNARYTVCEKQAEARVAANKLTAENLIISENGAKFRNLRNQYSDALEGATGKAINIDTSECEKGSLTAQSSCFRRIDKMIDCLYTGQSCTSGEASGEAIGLTGGKASVKDFLGTVTAKNDPNRSLTVACSGVKNCLSQYTQLRTGLVDTVKQTQRSSEAYKTNLNQRLVTAVSNLAGGKDPNTGAPLPYGETLNKVTARVEEAKNKIMKAMGRLKVKDGLSLDVKEVEMPEIDKNTGLFKSTDLRNLVLKGINPGLPDTNSKGFGDATTAVGERDDALETRQQDLDGFITELESAKTKCTSDAKAKNIEIYTKECDRYTENYRACLKGKEDPVNQLAKAVGVLVKPEPVLGQTNGRVETSATMGLNCGVAQSSMDDACAKSVNMSLQKSAGSIGGGTGTGMSSSGTEEK